jgi:MFS transporter, PAT family, beta-lactamase induction signal transducer AmpG
MVESDHGEANMAEEQTQARRKAFGFGAILSRREVWICFLLGIATATPTVVTGVTLGFWLREEGLTLQTIGFLSWIGLVFGLKALWSPVVERVTLPFTRKFGRLRGWMLLGQIVVGFGLLGMALIGPKANLALFAGFALVAAFASATQDIAADSWRIEAAGDPDQELFAASYIFGLRLGLVGADAGVLFGAQLIGWSGAYQIIAASSVIGLLAVALAREPHVAARPLGKGLRGFADAVIAPLRSFFATYGAKAVLMAALMTLYLAPDIIIAPMTGPLYIDLIASVRLVVGSTGLLLGVVAAGAIGARFGAAPALILGGVLAAVSNLGLAILALNGGAMPVFATAILVEGFGAGFATAALVAWMSRLTMSGFSATQFALLSSLTTVTGNAMRGFSGLAVEALQAHLGDVEGFAAFFVCAGLVGVPVLMLALIVTRVARTTEA